MIATGSSETGSGEQGPGGKVRGGWIEGKECMGRGGFRAKIMHCVCWLMGPVVNDVIKRKNCGG